MISVKVEHFDELSKDNSALEEAKSILMKDLEDVKRKMEFQQEQFNKVLQITPKTLVRVLLNLKFALTDPQTVHFHQVLGVRKSVKYIFSCLQ